jgi:predicted nucleic acid-binding Zn ribbon protein
MYNPSHVCAVHAKAAKTAERHPPVERVARLAACTHCGAEFEARKASRRYCSDRCRMAAYQARRRAADLEQHLTGRTSDRFA